jgi:hypothetical protein
MSWKLPITRCSLPLWYSACPSVRTQIRRPAAVTNSTSRSKGVPFSTHASKAFVRTVFHSAGKKSSPFSTVG